MAGFLYWTEAEQIPGRMEQIPAGIRYAFDRLPTAVPIARGAGPGGRSSGITLGDRSHQRVGYYPDEQEWRQLPASWFANGPAAWVGRFKNDPPKPEELIRDDPLPGHSTELADHQNWLCPTALGFVEGDGDGRYQCRLPTRRSLDSEGRWRMPAVIERYRPLWDLSGRWFDAVTNQVGLEQGSAERDIDFEDDGYPAAEMCLAANYRVSSIELEWMGTLDSRSIGAVLNALIDGPTVMAFSEQKRLALTGTSAVRD